ncbi:hypothetical protein [Paenibacillus hamazuiensis]|uniref:hypothetical protein n=1 Tax=Paenibacillus hamazuiensis TaxID=2936508 RepID=UPI00200F7767|nr:hypothetical protein [Paenibacillus hamazuiensis]
MEKTIYELNYNDWFSMRMMSEREPMEELEFDLAALEAVLADMVLRAKNREREEDGSETRALWTKVFTQIGMALQNTELGPLTEEQPLDTVMRVVSQLKGETP